MARTDWQQAQTIFAAAHRILITFPASKANTAVGSALALSQSLEKLGKRADIVSAGFELPGNLKFLPNAKRITGQITSLRKFIINLNLERTPLKDLSYSLENNKLNIYLTPLRGMFSSQDLTTRASDFNYDLIVTIDTPDLNSLGNIFQDNTEFFYQTTILNIDCSVHNEHFGQINLVNFNLASSAELVHELIELIAPETIDADIATCLYTSLTVASKSFTSPQVTPQTLQRAGQLVTLGARREEVVTHLFRTKKLPLLKLWGRVLARLKSDSGRKLVWSLLTPDDFIKAGASEIDLPGVVDELITGAVEAKTVVLLYEQTAGTTSIYLHAGLGRRADELLKPFNSQGDQHIARAILRNTSLIEAEKKVIDHLKSVIQPLEQ
jgi:nanoRNase/pAp phosphatase (c-di-AMP/oligoRNAs hydrolase)